MDSTNEKEPRGSQPVQFSVAAGVRKQSANRLLNQTEANLILYLYPACAQAKALRSCLELIVDRSGVALQICGNRKDLLWKIHEASTDGYDLFNSDVVLLNSLRSSEVFPLNLDLRRKTTIDSKGWAGQIDCLQSRQV